MIRIERPGPGNGWRQTIGSGSPSSSPTRRTSSLKSERSGSTSSIVMSAGQPADVVVRLDLRGDALGAAGLDHVRVERALDEEARLAQLLGLLFEDADELLADDPALLLRLGHALEPREEAVGRVDVDERDVEVALERLDHLRGLVLAQQAVVDEDAGQLVADRLVHEQRRDRRVDAAGERAEDALAADLRADPLDLLLDHGRGRPGRPRAGDAVEEVLQHLLAVRRVHDLRVELDAVELRGPAPRSRRSESTRSRAVTVGALGRRGHRVAVAHPAGLLLGQAADPSAPPTRNVVLPNSPAARSTRPPRSCAISCMP